MIPFVNRAVLEKNDEINVVGIHRRFEGPENVFDDFRFPFYKDDKLSSTFEKYQASGAPHWILVNAEGEMEYSIFGSDPNNVLLRLDSKMNEPLSPNYYHKISLVQFIIFS